VDYAYTKQNGSNGAAAHSRHLQRLRKDSFICFLFDGASGDTGLFKEIQ